MSLAKIVDRVKASVPTTGTGAITIGAAYAGFRNFSQAGLVNGDQVRYVIEDGTAWELGLGTVNSSGGMTRTVLLSSNANNPLNLSGAGILFLTASSHDLLPGTVLELAAGAQAYVSAQRAYELNAPLAVSANANFTLDFGQRRVFEVTLGASVQMLVPSNMIVGQMGEIDIVQDATGGRVLTIPSAIKTRGGFIPPSTTALARTTYGYRVRTGPTLVLTYGDVEQ